MINKLILLTLFLLLFIICKNLDVHDPTQIEYDFTPLMVGNTWTYLECTNFQLVKDSSFRTITVTGKSDTCWFLSIKDSTYYIGPAGVPHTRKIDTIARFDCDTCKKDNFSIVCNKLTAYFIDTNLIDSCINPLYCNDSSYLYYNKKWYDINSTYYHHIHCINNIGLIYYLTYPGATRYPGSESKILTAFNNKNNSLYQCLSNISISNAH